MFKVYGKNPDLARRKAAKKVGRYVKDHRRTDDEMETEIEAVSASILEKQKPEPISAELSSPELCGQFICMAVKNGCTDIQVKIKVPVSSVDSKGRAKIVQRFVCYVEGDDYSDPIKNAQLS